MKYAMMVVMVATSTAFAGNVCTWTGGGSDGKWSTAANWENATKPVAGNGDVVVFENAGDGTLTVENDIADLSIAGVAGYVGGAVRITGTALAIGAPGAGPFKDKSVTNHAATLTFDVPVQFTSATANVCYERDVTFNGAVTFGPSVTKFTTTHRYSEGAAAAAAGIVSSTLAFNASVTGPDVTFDVGSSGTNPIRFNAPVTFKSIVGGGGWPGVYFNAAGNKYGSCTTKFNHLRFTAENAADPETILSFTSDAYNGRSYGDYWLTADQVLYGFESIPYPQGPDQFLYCCDKTTGATLTLRPARDLEAWVRLGDADARGHFSLVYDPQVDCTQTLHDVSHAMDGTIKVKDGTLRFDMASKLLGLKELVVEGGVFETVCTNDTAMFSDKLRSVVIGGTGTLRAGSDRAVSPFSDDVTDVRISDGGIIEVGQDVAIRFKSVVYRGVPLANGTYTAGNCAWVKGAGSVSVTGAVDASCWSEASDGPWTGEGNLWTPSVPGAGATGLVYAEGSDYEVALGTGIAFPSVLKVGQCVDPHFATLAVSGAVEAGSPDVEISRNGIFKMVDGLYVQTNGSFRVTSGGCLAVTGGTFRVASTVQNGSTFSLEAGAKLVATAGRVELPVVHSDLTDVNYPDSAGSVIELSGTAQLDFNAASNKRAQPKFRGTVKLSDDARIGFAQPYFDCASDAGTTNSFTFAGRAAVDWSNSPIVVFGSSYNNGGWLVCDFSSSNAFAPSYGMRFGDEGNTRVDVHGDGVLSAPNFELALGGTRASKAHETFLVVRDGGKVLKNTTLNYAGNPFGFRIRHDATVRVAPGGTLEVGWAEGSSGDNGAWFLVGAGNEEGRLEVTGGKVTHYDRFQMMIGGFGGVGTWLQTAGTTTVTRTEVYVGGATTNLLTGFTCGANKAACASTFNNFAADSAVGTLRLEGGTFTCAKSVVVGLDGRGSLEIGPSTTANLTAENVVLTNAATSVGLGRAAVSFTFGAAGTGCITATDRLVIASGSKLTVDASALTDARKSWHPLIRFNSVEGDFDSADVAFTKPTLSANRSATIVKTVHNGVNAYWLHVSRGTMLLFR